MQKTSPDSSALTASTLPPLPVLDPALAGRLRALSDAALHSAVLGAARKEQGATLALLSHLEEIEKRSVYLAYGFSSLWDYTMRYLGYSAAGASERIRAMRLVRESGEARKMLESGGLTLTSAAKVQSFLSALQKTENRKLEVGEAQAVLAQVEGRSSREVEQILFDRAPHAARPREAIRPLGRGLSEVRIVVDDEMLKLLEEAKVLFRAGDQVEAMKAALKFAVVKKEREMAAAARGERASVRAPELRSGSETVPLDVRREAWTRAGSRCEWVDPATKVRCPSDYLLEYDHIVPRAFGGRSELPNIRVLCRKHNVIAAERAGLKVGPRASAKRTPPLKGGA